MFSFSLKSFQRITSGNRKFIPEIDGLRFIAIITVVFLHTNTNFKRVYEHIIPAEYNGSSLDHIFSLSGIGVDLFFSISGFILGLPFARYYLLGERKVNIKSYFIRRLTRLEPPYIIALLLLYVGVTIFEGVNFSEYFNNLVASIFYSHSIVFGSFNPINPVTWSLETEVQFYILAPLLGLLLFTKYPWVRRIVLASIIVSLNWGVPAIYKWLEQVHLNKSIINYLHSFLVGFAFVEVFLFGLDKIRKGIWWDIIGVLAIVGMYTFIPDDLFRYERIYFDISVFLLFISVFKGVVFNYIFTRQFIVVVGGMCYTIYLLHYPVLFVTMKIFSAVWVGSFIPTIIINFIVSILLLLGVSAVFFKLIEQPCMDKNWPTQLKEFFKQRFSKANAEN